MSRQKRERKAPGCVRGLLLLLLVLSRSLVADPAEVDAVVAEIRELIRAENARVGRCFSKKPFGAPLNVVEANMNCGLCQGGIHWLGRARGLDPITHNISELMPGPFAVRHALGVLVDPKTGKAYFVDTTGGQYFRSNPDYKVDRLLPSENVKSPAQKALWRDLLAKGYVPLTEETVGPLAEIYGGPGAKVPSVKEFLKETQAQDYTAKEFAEIVGRIETWGRASRAGCFQPNARQAAAFEAGGKVYLTEAQVKALRAQCLLPPAAGTSGKSVDPRSSGKACLKNTAYGIALGIGLDEAQDFVTDKTGCPSMAIAYATWCMGACVNVNEATQALDQQKRLVNDFCKERGKPQPYKSNYQRRNEDPSWMPTWLGDLLYRSQPYTGGSI